MADMIATVKLGGNFDERLTRAMFKQRGGHDGGSVTLLRPDGREYTIDGNDNIWVSNFAGAHCPIVKLCGARTEKLPPGFKTRYALGKLALHAAGTDVPDWQTVLQKSVQ